MVQQSPDMAQALPEDLAELAASMDDMPGNTVGLPSNTSTAGAAVAAVSRANNVAAAGSGGGSEVQMDYEER